MNCKTLSLAVLVEQDQSHSLDHILPNTRKIIQSGLTENNQRLDVHFSAGKKTFEMLEGFISTCLSERLEGIPRRMTILNAESSSIKTNYINFVGIIKKLVELNGEKLKASLKRDSEIWADLDISSSSIAQVPVDTCRVNLSLKEGTELAEITFSCSTSWQNKLTMAAIGLNFMSHVALLVNITDSVRSANADGICSNLLVHLQAQLCSASPMNYSPEQGNFGCKGHFTSPVTFQNKTEMRDDGLFLPSPFEFEEELPLLSIARSKESSKANPERNSKKGKTPHENNSKGKTLDISDTNLAQQGISSQKKTPLSQSLLVKQNSEVYPSKPSKAFQKLTAVKSRSLIDTLQPSNKPMTCKKYELNKCRESIVSFCSPQIVRPAFTSTTTSIPRTENHLSTHVMDFHFQKKNESILISALDSNIATPVNSDHGQQNFPSPIAGEQERFALERERSKTKPENSIITNLQKKFQVQEKKSSSRKIEIDMCQEVNSSPRIIEKKGFIQIKSRLDSSPNQLIQSDTRRIINGSPASIADSLRLIKCLDDIKHKSALRSSMKSAASERENKELKAALAVREEVCNELYKQNSLLQEKFEDLMQEVTLLRSKEKSSKLSSPLKGCFEKPSAEKDFETSRKEKIRFLFDESKPSKNGPDSRDMTEKVMAESNYISSAFIPFKKLSKKPGRLQASPTFKNSSFTNINLDVGNTSNTRDMLTSSPERNASKLLLSSYNPLQRIKSKDEKSRPENTSLKRSSELIYSGLKLIPRHQFASNTKTKHLEAARLIPRKLIKRENVIERPISCQMRNKSRDCLAKTSNLSLVGSCDARPTITLT